jgi:DNA sulfur modification protein DndC
LIIYKPDEIEQFIEQGAIFYISHSGGKDSQAMYAKLLPVIPHEHIGITVEEMY